MVNGMVRIGDVIELDTAVGLAYGQVTHRVPLYGTLIRVLSRVAHERPISLPDLVQGPERFWVFFPVGAALKRGLVRKIGNASVPEASKAFPLLRKRGALGADGKVAEWWLWDGCQRSPITGHQ